MYADVVTKSIQACLDETKRRRIIQHKYNEEDDFLSKLCRIRINHVCL
jgi:excinuclease ABC subunit B